MFIEDVKNTEENTLRDQLIIKIRTIAFVLLGVAALVLKRHYAKPLGEVAWNYSGNVSVSFAVYFIMTLQPFPLRSRRLWAAGAALLVVELFEAFDGFGVMSNVYDPIDFVANLVGVGLAMTVDWAVSRISSRRSNRSKSSSPDGNSG